MKTDSKYCITRFAMIIAFLFMAGGAPIGCTHQKPVAKPPTLYERLGGINNIALLVDDIIERSYVDPVFEANPRIHAAHQRFPKAVYKFNATALACQVMGGPQVYTGRSLKEAHQHLIVTEKEWQAYPKVAASHLKKAFWPNIIVGGKILFFEMAYNDQSGPVAPHFFTHL